jgi:hypothetical protein
MDLDNPVTPNPTGQTFSASRLSLAHRECECWVFTPHSLFNIILRLARAENNLMDDYLQLKYREFVAAYTREAQSACEARF